MKDNFEASFRFVMVSEGGFVNNSKDPGGMTNLGVTKAMWQNFVGHAVDEQDMRSLTNDMVRPFYLERYWNAVRGDELPSGLDYIVFDCAVNSGPGRAIKLLQGIWGMKQDGVLGPITMGRVLSSDPRETINQYARDRLTFLQSLPVWGDFGKGWASRCNQVEQQALTLA